MLWKYNDYNRAALTGPQYVWYGLVKITFNKQDDPLYICTLTNQGVYISDMPKSSLCGYKTMLCKMYMLKRTCSIQQHAYGLGMQMGEKNGLGF